MQPRHLDPNLWKIQSSRTCSLWRVWKSRFSKRPLTNPSQNISCKILICDSQFTAWMCFASVLPWALWMLCYLVSEKHLVIFFADKVKSFFKQLLNLVWFAGYSNCKLVWAVFEQGFFIRHGVKAGYRGKEIDFLAVDVQTYHPCSRNQTKHLNSADKITSQECPSITATKFS